MVIGRWWVTPTRPPELVRGDHFALIPYARHRWDRTAHRVTSFSYLLKIAHGLIHSQLTGGHEAGIQQTRMKPRKELLRRGSQALGIHQPLTSTAARASLDCRTLGLVYFGMH